MKVSVIIPNFNHAKYLEQRIDSVLNQTFKDYEIIILDDCSSDDSRSIIEKYRENEKVSSIIFNDENSGGVFRQWIKGLNAASGEYIWIAESDDCADPHFLEKSLGVMQCDIDVKMVFTDSYVIDEGNKIIDKTSDTKKKSYISLKNDGCTINSLNFTRYLFLDMIITNASCVLFDKSVFFDINLEMLKEFKNTGDRFTYVGIAISNNIKFLDQPLSYMRSHERNTTKLNLENGNIFIDRLKVLSYYLGFLTLNNASRLDLRFFFEHNYFQFVEFCDFYKIDDVLKSLKKMKIISSFHYYSYSYYNRIFNNLFKQQIPVLRRGYSFLLRKSLYRSNSV